MRRVRDTQGFQAVIPANPVFDVNNEIAERYFGNIRDEIFGPAALAVRAHDALAEDVLFRDQRQGVGRKPVFDRQDDKASGVRRKPGCGLPVLDRNDIGNVVIGEQLAKPFAGTERECGYEDPLAGISVIAQACRQTIKHRDLRRVAVTGNGRCLCACRSEVGYAFCADCQYFCIG